MRSLNARSVVLVLMMVVVVLLLSAVVSAGFIRLQGIFLNGAQVNPNHLIQSARLDAEGNFLGINISGSAYNFSLGNITVNETENSDITNITLGFYHQSNDSFMGNFSARNTTAGTANTSAWNITVNTLSLADGVYNVMIFVQNASNDVVVNASMWANVTVDNTPPRSNFSQFVGDFQSLQGNNHSLNATSAVNKTFIAFARDINISVSAHLTVERVIFSFSNGTGTGNPFNLTAFNDSGNWTLSYNITLLRPGSQVVTVIANDTRGNVNSTSPAMNITFNVNTPHNITFLAIVGGLNVTNSSLQNQTINISVVNGTPQYRVQNVTFSFNNASNGNGFNISLEHSLGGVFGLYWAISVNLSTLRAGTHTVTAIINDTDGNVNNTQTMATFYVNIAQNVTFLNNRSLNFSMGTNNQTFNISILNVSIHQVK